MRPELDDTAAAHDITHTAPKSAAPAAEMTAGMRLGHFRIDKKLGAGGMGEVYLATDLALDRPVAIKVLPGTSATRAQKDRMVREARAQARVVHPNVAHIYFIGEDNDRLYFAMEYVPGKTLGDRIAAGPLGVEEALATVRAAALGLREAQRSGFTHRDVKPSNLMVDAHGVIKVLDFGLAAGAPERASDTPVAQTSLAGTPLYMAPEQARGEPVDLRADIYALGATLYHLVSGKPPFEADSVEKLITLHASAARPNVPRNKQPRTQIAAIDALVARMMAPRPEDRFASYDELLRAIELASLQHTRPAGLWVRAIATAIDFVAVSLAAILVVIAGQFVMQEERGNVELNNIIMPAFAVYAVLCTGRWGRTLGQWLFELEVVDAMTGRRPRWRQALGRSVLLVALPMSAELLRLGIDAVGYQPFGAGFLVVALVFANVPLLWWASLRVPGKRALWDRWSNTLVRYRTSGLSS